MSGTQSSCSMKLLKQLCCTLPSLFLLWLAFYFVCCHSLFLCHFLLTFWTRWNTCRKSCSGVNCSISARLKPFTISPASQPAKSPEASLDHKAHPFWSAYQLITTSPVTKKHSIERPIETHALWSYHDWPKKYPFMFRIQSHGEMQESSVPSDL